MKSTGFYLLLGVAVAFKGLSQNRALPKDVFGTRVFIENKGQFDKSINGSEQVLFAYESANEHIYFTPSGPVYKLMKKQNLTEEQVERMDEGKKVRIRPDEIHYVKVNWLNANSNIRIEESQRQNHYFSYGYRSTNSPTYKKITYKNVYNNIDIEYTFPEDKEYGIKYNVILHPGANPADIRIAYTGAVKGVSLKKGNAVVNTPLENITEYAPVCYYEDGGKVPCSFNVENDIISYSFPSGVQPNKTLIIDPFVVTLTSLLSNNWAYDVDYDAGGNLFVYGGLNQIKIAKYDPAGNLIWTFSGQIVVPITWNTQGNGNTYIGNFLVNKINGKIYVGQGFEPGPGATVVRLDQLGNYDNFITTAVPSFREMWDLGFHCGTGNVYGMGGTTQANTSAGLIDQITGSMTPVNFTGLGGVGQDVVSNAIDDLGNVFVILASASTPGANNRLLRINPAFNGNIWSQPSTYNTLSEAANKNQYGGGLQSNGFNCLAVNNDYLYYYDGLNLAAYNKNTGVKLGFTTIPGYTAKAQGGIDVDDCNNVYIGGVGNILVFNYNGASFAQLPSIPLGVNTPVQKVFDIKLHRPSKLLYVAGSGFAGTYTATQNCGLSNNVAVNGNCNGYNSSTGVITVTTSIANPTMNYVWISGGNTVSAVTSTLTSNTNSNLPNGLYTVLVQINAPCGPSFTSTVNLVCCPGISMSNSITQSSCTNNINSATLSIAGAGTLTPQSITWSPAPNSVAGNSMSATGLTPGVNTVVVNYGGGCSYTNTMNIQPTPPPVTIAVNNLTGTYTITCLNPTINLQAVSGYTFGSLTYSWTSISFTASTPTVALTEANCLTVTAVDPATGCMDTKTVCVGINTLAPTSTVSPLQQAVTCNSTSPVTFTSTITNPTVNIEHQWFNPLNPAVPQATAGGVTSVLGPPFNPGVYTVCAVNMVNGCKTCRNFTVTSLSAFPNFSMSSSTNFSVGCSPNKNTTTITIVNPVSTQTPPATTSWTFLPPGFAGVVSPSVVLNTTNNSTVTTTPGTWTVIVQDNSNFCRTELSIPITQNTVGPHVMASMATQTLLCKTPTILATGSSSTANTTIEWNVALPPPNNLPSSTLVIGTPSVGPITSSTSLTYANYTVIATNTVNGCTTTSIVTISQNFRPPVSDPKISIATPTAIYCTAATDPVRLTTGNSTVTSGMQNAFASPLLWQGPPPQYSISGVSTYSAFIPGIYTLTIIDSENGCTKSNTIEVIDRTQPPVLLSPLDSVAIPCGSSAGTLQFVLTGTTVGGHKYFVYDYPQNTTFAPPSANDPIQQTSSQTVAVSKAGTYKYIVTNTLTGCLAYGEFKVTTGGINAAFTADPSSGFAPLNVAFINQTSTSGNNNIWSFGNGTSSSSSVNANAATVYNAPGTYTVLLIAQKGDCIDTAYRVVKVDIPSKLDIPNVFTPNKDGSNDVWFLHATNISRISAIIYDRWGNKVFEVESNSGNIAWDGTSLDGKECAAGVYFYVITAEGKDTTPYEYKGNVSLYR